MLRLRNVRENRLSNDGKSEEQARSEILQMVSEYCNKYHSRGGFHLGDRIPYASRMYDGSEMVNLVDASLDFWLTSGKYVSKFEQLLCDYLGVKYCSFVNSGSSANLLAFMALTSPVLKEKRIMPGDEVITIACGFPTTVSPCIQYGAVPVFVDITIPQYNIDVDRLEDALSGKTKAVILAHTLGNPFDIIAVKRFCEEHDLWLIEDNCDSLGSMYQYDGNHRYTGTIGDIGTSSFYPAHHITTGEGGAVYTNNPVIHKIIRSLRDWGRDCSCPPGVDDSCGCRFTWQYGDLPLGYDHKYVYSNFGYNLKATEMQAAIGCAQMKKLPSFVDKRRENHRKLTEKLKCVQDRIILPESLPYSRPSWFGFLITCREKVDKNKVVQHLEKNGIQTRMLFAGNIIRHPCFDEMRTRGSGYRVVGELTNTDIVVNKSFWIGVYPGMTEEMLDFMAKNIIEAVR